MAKSKWPKLPSYTIPLFNSANVYLAVTKDEWCAALDSIKAERTDLNFSVGRAANFENEDTGERMYMIGVFDKNLSTLVHECAHVCFYTCADVGVTTRPDEANETYCYMLDRMFSHFAPFIAKLAFEGEEAG